ncbi:MAG: hypothetical protein GY777_18515 [Candidatus Brocadiaceae bacterium]|nr:hypothetical protein [Candidatus Brocadiaceae bacterium]
MEDEKSQIDIQRYIKLLLRRKWMWIIPTILFSAVAITYARILPDIYQSKCVMIVEESKVLDNLLSRRGGRKLDVKNLLQAVRERMLGWRSVVLLVGELDLDKDVPEDDEGAMENLYKKIVDDTSIKVKGSNLIEVAYQGENPDINYRMVDGLVSNFMEFSLKESRTEADETVEFIETDLKRLKRDLEASEQQLQQFEEDHYGELPGSGNSLENTLISRRAAAENELLVVGDDITILSERIGFLDTSIEKEDKTVTGEVTRIPNPMVSELKTQINALEIEVNSLRTKYFDEHPSIVKKLKELDSLNEMLKQEDESIVSEEKIINNPMYEGLMEEGFSAQLQLKTLQRRQKVIESTIAEFSKTIMSMPALRQQQNELKRGYVVTQRLYEQRLVEKAKADLMKEMSLDAKTNPFNIVEPARISYEPIKKIKMKIVGMGFIMGLGLGVGLILGLDKIDPRFRNVEEVQDYLNIPALGMIPIIVSNTETKVSFRKMIGNKVTVRSGHLVAKIKNK